MIIQDYQLRADLPSLRRGIKYWYGGKENEHLATLLFNYFSCGAVNHQVTFSQFLKLIRDLKLGKVPQNTLAFKLLADGASEMEPTDILRQYVATAKNSVFAAELKELVEDIVKQYQKKLGGHRLASAARNTQLNLIPESYSSKVPYSCLAEELVYKLLEIPRLAYEKDSGLFKPGFLQGPRRQQRGKEERSSSGVSKHSMGLKSFRSHVDKSRIVRMDSESTDKLEHGGTESGRDCHSYDFKGRHDPTYSCLHPDPALEAAKQAQNRGTSGAYDEDEELRKSCKLFSIKINYQNTEKMMGELTKLLARPAQEYGD